MDTSPIFDYLYEIETRRSFLNHPPTNLSGRREFDWNDYVHLMRRMKTRFEACVFQCVAENPSFKEELHVIANKLNHYKAFYKIQEKDTPDKFDDSCHLAMTCAEGGLRFLRENYGVIPDASVETIVPEKNEGKNSGEDEIITGVRALANTLGIGANKAQAIVSSGILVKEGIQWDEGFWKFNKTKLLQFKKDNPDFMSKIKCKR